MSIEQLTKLKDFLMDKYLEINGELQARNNELEQKITGNSWADGGKKKTRTKKPKK